MSGAGIQLVVRETDARSLSDELRVGFQQDDTMYS